MDRDEAYSVIDQLVSKGFLCLGLDIEGDYFIFKTINEQEFDLIKKLSGDTEDKSFPVRYRTSFLSYSVFSINGQNILYKREEKFEKLFKLFKKMPVQMFMTIDKEMDKLKRQMIESVKYVEGYTYTDASRRRWKMLGEKSPTCVDFTGVPGTNMLGLNVHQELWISLNRIMDDEEKYNREFSNSLFIASSNNPKGVKKARSQHNADWENVLRKRTELASVGYIDRKKKDLDRWSDSVETREELVAELDRQIKGEKDRHDLFIDEYLNEIRVEADQKRAEVEKRLEERKKMSDTELISVMQRELTPEETKKLNEQTPVYTVAVKDEDEASPEQREKFMKKIGSRIITGDK